MLKTEGNGLMDLRVVKTDMVWIVKHFSHSSFINKKSGCTVTFITVMLALIDAAISCDISRTISSNIIQIPIGTRCRNYNLHKKL